MKTKKVVDIITLLLYVAVIYSTLSLTPKLFSFLSKALGNKISLVINIALGGVISSLLVFFHHRLKGRRPIAYIGFIVVIAIYGILLMLCTPIVAEKIHLIEYGFLGYIALRVLRDVRSKDARYIYIALIIIAVGYFDELIQRFLPNRVYDIMDVYLNVLSGLLGLALLRLLGFDNNSATRSISTIS